MFANGLKSTKLQALFIKNVATPVHGDCKQASLDHALFNSNENLVE